jgi:hypothetical protein
MIGTALPKNRPGFTLSTKTEFIDVLKVQVSMSENNKFCAAYQISAK